MTIYDYVYAIVELILIYVNAYNILTYWRCFNTFST